MRLVGDFGRDKANYGYIGGMGEYAIFFSSILFNTLLIYIQCIPIATYLGYVIFKGLHFLKILVELWLRINGMTSPSIICSELKHVLMKISTLK